MMYVYIQDKKTLEVTEHIPVEVSDSYCASHAWYCAWFDKPYSLWSTQAGRTAGRRTGLYYHNLGRNEGEIYYNALWLEQPDLEKAKKLFAANDAEKLEEQRKALERRINKIKRA